MRAAGIGSLGLSVEASSQDLGGSEGGLDAGVQQQELPPAGGADVGFEAGIAGAGVDADVTSGGFREPAATASRAWLLHEQEQQQLPGNDVDRGTGWDGRQQERREQQQQQQQQQGSELSALLAGILAEDPELEAQVSQHRLLPGR
jgi:hypothetical protein